MDVRKKKRIIVYILLAVCILLGGIMILRLLLKKFNKPVEIDQGSGLPVTIDDAEPVLFENFEIQMQGMEISQYIAEGGKTEKGAYLEYYVKIERYNSETDEDYDEKQIIRRIEGDADFYDTLCKILGAYKVTEWDGFQGKNPPGVLDGESGYFKATLSDQSTIYAYGSNNFPANFSGLHSLLRDMAVTDTVSQTNVNNAYFSVEVPQEWIGVVKTRYDAGMLIFFVTDTKGNELSFLIFDYNVYWYGGDKFTHLGILRNPDDENSEEYFVVARNHTSLKGYYETLTEEQKKVCDSYEFVEQLVMESLCGINGYILFGENEE